MKINELDNLRMYLERTDIHAMKKDIYSAEGIMIDLFTSLSQELGVEVTGVEVKAVRELASKAPVGYFVDLEFEL